MIELIGWVESHWLYLLVVVTVAGLFTWLVSTLVSRAQQVDKDAASPRDVTEWKATGRIDFAADDWNAVLEKEADVPDRFYLRVEELRTVQNIVGSKTLEVRWRQASLTEAKEIVSRYLIALSEHPDWTKIDDPERMASIFPRIP